MAKPIDYFRQLVGIGQGVEWLWKLGGPLVVSGLTAGAAALAALPWWSIVLIGIGTFMVALGAIVPAARRLRRGSPLAPIIDRGYAMRERLVADQDDGSDQGHVASWRTRLDDWTEEARTTIRAIAPNREPSFNLDILVADVPLSSGMPYWKAELITELDVAVERLVLIRASL